MCPNIVVLHYHAVLSHLYTEIIAASCNLNPLNLIILPYFVYIFKRADYAIISSSLISS